MITIKKVGKDKSKYKVTWQYAKPELSITLTKDERSLMLYLETRAVDHGGRVDTRHMNARDMKTAQRWAKTPIPGLEHPGMFPITLIQFGRLKAKNVTPSGTHYVTLSYQMFDIVGALRRKRAMDSCLGVVDEAIRG